MLNDKQQKEFEEMVVKGVEGFAQVEIDEQDLDKYPHGPQEDELTYKEHCDAQCQMHRMKTQTKILECSMDTQDYMGFLKCSEVLAKLNDEPLKAGFYKGRHDKFIMENTP